MMKSKNITKEGFNYTFPELVMRATEKSAQFKRDEVHFVGFGIPSSRIQNFELKVAELKTLPTDLEMEGNKMVSTELKQQLAQELRLRLKKLIVSAKTVYPEGSSKLRSYTIIDAPSQLTDIELSFHVNTLERLTRLNINDFTEVGLTLEFCDSLFALQDSFYNQYADITIKIDDRDNATAIRWTKANELYKEMATLCEIGKTIFESVSEAHYNDYVLYPTSSSTKNNVDDETPEVIEDDTQGDTTIPFNG